MKTITMEMLGSVATEQDVKAVSEATAAKGWNADWVTRATTYINCTEDNVSLGIRAECRDAQAIELLGRYPHPSNPYNADAMISLYEITAAEGWKTRAVATNGDPLWEENDSEVFAATLEEYGIA